jgi:predicted SAM-dependent methyltransferase
MDKLNYLNVGCGDKFHNNWVNIDMVSSSPDVMAANILKGMPFPDNHFNVVYHSQVLEHIPKEKAEDFIRECYRVLKPGGIIRIVVPDLENIVDEYKKNLNENLSNPNALSEANYDWIMLEMYDQTVRNYTGGQMAEYIKQPGLINEKYLIDRIGYNRIDEANRSNLGTGNEGKKKYDNKIINLLLFNPRYIQKVKQKLKQHVKHLIQTKESKTGEFRLGGEVHMWMYDRYSLSRLLNKCGFEGVSIKNPFESDILNWKEYELDVKDNIVYDPASLFIEARK